MKRGESVYAVSQFIGSTFDGIQQSKWSCRAEPCNRSIQMRCALVVFCQFEDNFGTSLSSFPFREAASAGRGPRKNHHQQTPAVVREVSLRRADTAKMVMHRYHKAHCCADVLPLCSGKLAFSFHECLSSASQPSTS